MSYPNDHPKLLKLLNGRGYSLGTIISKESKSTDHPPLEMVELLTDNPFRSNESEDSSAPLPKLAYGTMKEKGIRELLLKYSLSTHGDKAALVARHRQ